MQENPFGSGSILLRRRRRLSTTLHYVTRVKSNYQRIYHKALYEKVAATVRGRITRRTGRKRAVMPTEIVWVASAVIHSSAAPQSLYMGFSRLPRLDLVASLLIEIPGFCQHCQQFQIEVHYRHCEQFPVEKYRNLSGFVLYSSTWNC